MNSPLISVIVPVYKVEPYLSACVDSILSQSYRNLEVILVDDGSPDNCPAICDNYARKDERVRVIHQKNGGLSAARNAGIKQYTGDYLIFIDSDDFMHERLIETLLHLCQDYDCTIALTHHQRVPADTVSSEKIHLPLASESPEIVTGREANLKMYTAKDWATTTTANGKLFSRSVWGNTTFPDVVIHEDEALIYKILYPAKKVAYTSSSLYFYRINSSGIMANRFSPDKMVMLSILDERIAFYEKNQDSALIERTRNREFFFAVEYYQTILRQKPLNKKLLSYFYHQMWRLYPRLLLSGYPLKRKVFYTTALLAPQKFTRMYCISE